MTLIEAVKSGKRFRRPRGRISSWCANMPDDWHSFYNEEILADDWIIEEPAISLTESQIREAFRIADKLRHGSENILTEMLTELGFK